MLTQRLTIGNPQGTAGLLIVADTESVSALADLAAELAERGDMTTEGTITYSPPAEPPPPS